jgi:nucleotide-binding universal stress UspA family protein
MFSSILIPIDITNSESSKNFLQNAFSFVKKMNAVAHIVYVQSTQAATFMEYSTWPINDHSKIEDEQKLIKILSEIDLFNDLQKTIAIRSGNVLNEIIAEAREHQADLIIINSNTHGFTQSFMESIASKILRKASCSVLVLNSSD